MGIFSSIKNAIFGDDDTEETVIAPASVPTPAATPATTPDPTTVVNVEERLDAMDGADNLNWRTSIVDLMKLIGVDSSYGARKELAQELGREDYAGSAEDNIWLHKVTMQHLALNGGKVPDQFLD